MVRNSRRMDNIAYQMRASLYTKKNLGCMQGGTPNACPYFCLSSLYESSPFFLVAGFVGPHKGPFHL